MSDPLSLSFVDAHPQDAAHVLEVSSPPDAARFLESVSADMAARVVERMRPDVAALCVGSMDRRAAAGMMERMPMAPLVAVVRALRPERQREFFVALPDTLARRVMAALDMPNGLVGALMDSRVITVREDNDVNEAIQRIRETPDQLAKYLFVLGETGRLTGVVDTRDLLLADSGTRMTDLMTRNVISLPIRASIELIRDHPAWNVYQVLPVVDRRGIFQGIVRRRELAESSGRDIQAEAGDRHITDAVMSLADVFWAAGAEFLATASAREAGSNGSKEA